MGYWIDRFEGAYAVLEDENRKMHNIPREELPKDAQEGDFLLVTDTGYQIDKEVTKRKREEIKERMKRLFE